MKAIALKEFIALGLYGGICVQVKPDLQPPYPQILSSLGQELTPRGMHSSLFERFPELIHMNEAVEAEAASPRAFTTCSPSPPSPAQRWERKLPRGALLSVGTVAATFLLWPVDCPLQDAVSGPRGAPERGRG